VAGDIESSNALDCVNAYFGDISTGSVPERLAVNAALDGEVRLLLEDRVELPRLYLSWHSPALFAEGDAEMDLVSDLLANGKVSRLYRSLVYERRIATDVMAAQNSRELAGFFQLIATAAPGRSLAELDEAITAELSTFLDRGPTSEELERGRVQAETQFVYRLQTLGGFGGKSDQLNAYNVYLGDPGFFERDLARYERVSAQDLHAAAKRYLRPDRRVALSVVPKGKTELALKNGVLAVVS
jgi:zinc protease